MSVPLHDEMRIASQVAAQLYAVGIDESDEDFVALLASETDILERLRRILRAARYRQAQSKALAAIIDENRERKVRHDEAAERLREIVLKAMGDLGLTKLDGPDLSASVSAGKSKVVITDPTVLPDEVCVTKREPSKTAIAAWLAEKPCPGAEMSNSQPVLTVRTR